MKLMTVVGFVLACAIAGPSIVAAADVQLGRLTIIKPWARATPGGAKIGAAFVEVKAPHGVSDRLVGARSPIAAAVELHDHVKEGNVIKMRRVDAIEVPDGGSVTLMPGSYHLMLVGLKAPLAEGATVDVTLVFEKAGEVTLTLPILSVGSMGPDHEDRSGLKILAPKGSHHN